MNKKPVDYESYSLIFPEETQIILESLRIFLENHLPGAALVICYGIPTFKINGKNAVHFGAFKNHIGFYPGAETIAMFSEKLLRYKTSKGAVQFPIKEDLPLDLIKEIVDFRKNKI